MNDLVAQVRDRLEQAFQPSRLEIIDQGDLHQGHSYPSGSGHIGITIVADAFNDQSLLNRHRMIYSTLEDLMGQQIHALEILHISGTTHNH